MKKFNFRGVLDGIRSTVGSGGGSSSSITKTDTVGIEETILSEHFKVSKTVRHGFPFQPTALAYDPVQNLVAIGTKSGSIRIFGQPGVDCHIRHEAESAVIQLLFLVNEGALVSVCADDQLHLWTLRQKKPEIVHSLKFQRERITYCHLPFQSKWMYVGTERGNVHIVNLESFVLSGYVINWNKAIELIRKTHPGPVVHLSDNLSEPNKLLIGFETGLVVLWDLKEKTAECRYNSTEGLRSVAWHHEGKQFVCSHTDGSLTYWNTRAPQRPTSSVMPHSRLGRDGKPEPCRPILKVDLRTVRTGEPFVIFSGGMPFEKAGHTPTMTIMRGTSTTVLEMDHGVVDFVTVCATPWNNDVQDPTAVIILLQQDLVVVDLLSPGYPCFENPYQMDLHESPVTACLYFADCPPDLIPAYYSVGCQQKKTGYSNKEWPIKGGEWGSATCSYPEVILTGHADGSVKFWDSSVVTLQVLYKLKTAKFLEVNKCHGSDASDFPFAIHHLMLCVESRLLCIAGVGHVVLFNFSKQESMIECTMLEISIACELIDGQESPETECTSSRSKHNSGTIQPNKANSTVTSSTADKESQTCVKPKPGPRKWTSGYQPSLCCILTHFDGDSPPPITAISINAVYNLLTFSNESGLVIVDVAQKCPVMVITTPELYGSIDSYCRAHRSRTQPDGFCTPEDCKSPSVDQLGEELATSSQSVHTPVSISSNNDLQSEDIPDCRQNVSDEESYNSSDRGGNESPVKQVVQSVACSSEVDENGLSESQDSGSAGFKKNDSSLRRSSAPSKISKKLHLSLHGRASITGSIHNTSENVQPEITEKLPLKVSKSDMSSDRTVEQPVAFDLLTPDGQDVVDRGCPSTAPAFTSQKADSIGLMVKMNRKFRNYLRFSGKPGVESDPRSQDVEGRSIERAKAREIRFLDLTSDDVTANPSIQKLSYAVLTQIDKGDGSFCRSQSSSASSLDNIVTKEAIQCLAFAETFSRKSDVYTCPCLWIGTNIGSVLVIAFTVPPAELRNSESVTVASSGTVFRLKGSILSTTFLDCYGNLIPTLDDQWRDCNRPEDTSSAKERIKTCIRQQSVSNSKNHGSPTSCGSETSVDRHFVVICSEKQARVISLPSQSVVYKVKITETSAVAKADVISVRDSICLACFLLNGHIATFSLPSLKPLCDEIYLVQPDIRVERTFCFSNNCHALYFCSPTELQKLTLSAEVCEGLNEMLGELFLPRDMPEPPKQGFFKNLFGIGSSTMDREELFGEANNGKASKSLAKYTSGIGQAQESAGSATSAIAQAKLAAIERGEKLGDLEERTAQMRNEAEEYSKLAGQLKAKYRDKKWYQF